MTDPDLYNRAVEIVSQQRPDDVGPLDDDATELPADDLDYWDRVDAVYASLKRNLTR